MTTPTGQISLNDVNVELGLAGTTTISMNQTNVRTLAGVPSGAISMNDLRGKSNRVSKSYTFSANTANASLNLSAISGYVAGKTDITVTINTGVYLYSTSTGNYGLNITGGTTGDTLTIVNNGYIMGMGGVGAGCHVSGSFDYSFAYSPTYATSGGPALNFGFGLSSATVTNTSGYIGGGGGGGGGTQLTASAGCGGGGGAGAGTGGKSGAYNGYVVSITNISGGAGGGVGSSGSNGTNYVWNDGYGGFGGGCASGGGGGRIIPGSGGSGGTSGGANPGSGGGAGAGSGGCEGYRGANGGGAGSAGESTYNYVRGGGGGGWGASGGTCFAGNVGLPSLGNAGSGGKAVNLNGKSITWTGGSSSSSRAYGAVS